MKRDIGSEFDEYLREEKLLEAVEALAVKRILAWELGQEMERVGLSKTALAARIGTSRSQLNRLLDPANESVTLTTLARVASALGKRLRITLEPKRAA